MTTTPLHRLAAALALALLLPALAAAQEWPGFAAEPADPLPLPIVAPGFLFGYQPGPTSPTTLDAGDWQLRLDLSESNVLHPAEPVGGDVRIAESVLDLELTRLNLAVSRGLGERWELGLELPVYYFHQGFLDHAVRETESLVGKLKPRRENERQGQFTYQLRRGERVLFEVEEDELLAGDLALTAKRRLFAQHGRRPEMALSVALELPTGSIGDRLGSSHADLAVGAAAGWRVARLTVSGGLAATLRLGQPDSATGLTAMPTLAGWAEAAYPLTPRLTLHAQLAASTQPFRVDAGLPDGRPEVDLASFTGHVVQITPAISWRLPSGSALYLGVVEDFLKSENTASDVTLFTGVRLPAAIFAR